jgi:D-alanine-D-alanine ligase
MKIAVLYGGTSAEREISLQSGETVARELSQKQHEVLLLDTKDEFIHALRTYNPDVVYPALHGRMGEDGTIQGLLEFLGYPYVGSGVQASANAIDKMMTKRILRTYDLPLAKECILFKKDWEIQPWDDKSIERIAETIGWPMIIKPNQEGSTIGLTLAYTIQEARQGIEEALRYDSAIMMEEYITGMEVTAAVTDTDQGIRVLGIIEIVPKASYYDFESKYATGGSQHILPARLSTEQMKAIEDISIHAFKALLCRDYARVDLIVSATKGPIILEVNTLPGMTATSLVPDAARYAGYTLGDFLDELVTRAFRRNKSSKSNV